MPSLSDREWTLIYTIAAQLPAMVGAISAAFVGWLSYKRSLHNSQLLHDTKDEIKDEVQGTKSKVTYLLERDLNNEYDRGFKAGWEYRDQNPTIKPPSAPSNNSGSP